MQEVDKPLSQVGIAGARIEGHGVSKTYVTKEGEFQALTPIDFAIEAGEFVTIIGPSGCGKSTLMLMAAGLLPVTSGSIVVNGKVLTQPLTDIGVAFQDHLLLDFRTAEANILLQAQVRGMPMQAAREETRRLLKQLGLDKASNRYPRQLSGGMRQRVSLARALIHDPSVLMMDEPFGALDTITRTQMRHDLELLWMEKRKTVLFITHSVEEAIGLSDRVLVMSPSPGRIVEEIRIELPRPRPIELGIEQSFVGYADRVYEIFRELGVLMF
ncbi:MAG: ABC transporter ATP-binding protein [Chloroflexi bacterium]|nr:ABC transporter ATP-binding protein [Chloroflexota bacterium]